MASQLHGREPLGRESSIPSGPGLAAASPSFDLVDASEVSSLLLNISELRIMSSQGRRLSIRAGKLLRH
jgi:hypothetical protein